MAKTKEAICTDFDGVLHSYLSGWQGETVIPDPPVPGAIEWLDATCDVFTIHIYSARSRTAIGIQAMMAWLLENGLSWETLQKIEFPTQKPQARIYLDDRGWRFDGRFPSAKEILAFKPWYAK